METCSSFTLKGRKCKNSVYKNGVCWVHQEVKEWITCGICLDESPKSKKHFVLECKHIFCINCICQWIIQKGHTCSCPMCRTEVSKIEQQFSTTWGLRNRKLSKIHIIYYSLKCLDFEELILISVKCGVAPDVFLTTENFFKYSVSYPGIFLKLRNNSHAQLCIVKTELSPSKDPIHVFY